jgi:hypothetical protein
MGAACTGDREEGVNLGLQSYGEDMQMIFIRVLCDSSGDYNGYWFLPVLTLSCTLLLAYQLDLLVRKKSGQMHRAHDHY